MSTLSVGVVGFVFLFLLMALRVPIAWAMGIAGILGISYLAGFEPAAAMARLVPWTTTASYTFCTIPLFILMGEFVFHAGIGTSVFRAGDKWFRRFPGGLLLAALGASASFAAMSGSSVANAATMAVVAVPEMKKMKYNMSLVTGTIAGGGTLGILIPPSSMFVLYGIITETSIGDLFLSGLIPGIIMALLMMAVVLVITSMRPGLAPPGDPVSWRERLRCLPDLIPVLLIFLVVMGGIYGGIFTATEAAAFGSSATFVLLIAMRKANKTVMWHSLRDTMLSTCMIFPIFFGAIIFGYFLAMSRLPQELAALVVSVNLSPTGLLWITMLLFLIMGCIMDTGAMIILFVPILFPMIQAVGANPYLFGVLVVIASEMGLITPPIGLNCFVVAGVVKDVPLRAIFAGIWPMLTAQILTVPVVIFFPSVCLWWAK